MSDSNKTNEVIKKHTAMVDTALDAALARAYDGFVADPSNKYIMSKIVAEDNEALQTLIRAAIRCGIAHGNMAMAAVLTSALHEMKKLDE